MRQLEILLQALLKLLTSDWRYWENEEYLQNDTADSDSLDEGLGDISSDEDCRVSSA